MFISCGQDEHLRSPQKVYFSCVISIYLVSFFYEHPVVSALSQRKRVEREKRAWQSLKGKKKIIDREIVFQYQTRRKRFKIQINLSID